jgi:DNA-directed RNA polymerase subunit M/transcription elongation factor TFIIS
MSSLFALHYAALRAVHVTDARQFATLAATLSLSTTAALLRDLTTGRASGHGAPSLALCTALGRPPAGLLPPTAALLAQELGLPDTADGYDVLIPPPNPRFAPQTIHLDPAVLRAEKWAEAFEKAAKQALRFSDASCMDPKDMPDGMLQCRKCGSKKTSYYELQTRSADEPMTVFARCHECPNRWKQ